MVCTKVSEPVPGSTLKLDKVLGSSNGLSNVRTKTKAPPVSEATAMSVGGLGKLAGGPSSAHTAPVLASTPYPSDVVRRELRSSIREVGVHRICDRQGYRRAMRQGPRSTLKGNLLHARLQASGRAEYHRLAIARIHAERRAGVCRHSRRQSGHGDADGFIEAVERLH